VARSEWRASSGAGGGRPDPVGALAWCEDVSRTYRLPSGPVEALRGVDLAVAPGRLTVVAGPSGSGKSTLLRMVSLLERPSSGRVVLDGRDTTELSGGERRRLRRAHVAYVFQRPSDNLVDDVPVAGQLVLAAQLRGAAPPDPLPILERLGLAARAGHAPSRLSGGEQQRVAFAAAMASGAGLVVADEPTAQLDPGSAEAVLAAVRSLCELGATVLACSHDDAVVAAADRVVRIDAGRVVSAP
jgi:putative ABC transport system ATP-binding protein